MTDNVTVTTVVQNVVVTQNPIALSIASIGMQGPTGAQGLVPFFTRQNDIGPIVGNTRFYFDTTRIISQVRASVGTPSVGSGIVINTLINGLSIATTTIPAGANTITTSLTQTVNAGDYATISIISVGSTTPGADLTVVLTVN